MLKTIKKSSNKKTGPIAVTYRAGSGDVYSTCPSSCPLKPNTSQGCKEIDEPYLNALLNAVPEGGVSWTYTHFDRTLLPPPDRTKTTLNVSTDTWDSALASYAEGHPTVVVRPSGENAKVDVSPDGVRFVRCPAEYQDKITCQNCGGDKPLCSRQGRSYIIKFTAHGTSAKKIMMRAEGASQESGGCYGSSGPVHLQWKNTVGSTESDASQLLEFTRSLPIGTMLRHHVVGDIGLS